MTSLPLDTLRPFFGFCDPARGKSGSEVLKRLSSRSSVIVGGRDALNRVFIVYAWAARCPTTTLIEKLYEVSTRFSLKRLGVEANGLQALFSDALTRDAEYRGKRLPLVPVQQPTTIEKDFRIRTRLQPVIGHNRLFLLENDPGCAELRSEITTFPQNPLKDMVDACASLVAMIPMAAPRRERDAENEQLLRHLRSTGADPEYIKQVAARSSIWT